MHDEVSHPTGLDPTRPLSEDARQLATAVRTTLAAHPGRIWFVLGVLDHAARPTATLVSLTVALETLDMLGQGGDER
jgi:hypothetical protein